MEYILDVRFEDNNYNAVVHLITLLTADSDEQAQLFIDELIAGFKRRKITVLNGNFIRIDNDSKLKERKYEYYLFCLKRATATIGIEQFILKNPDQSKSVVENLTERLLNGENSTAQFGRKYNIPVRVIDKETRNPIAGEFYYMGIEHLIPSQN